MRRKIELTDTETRIRIAKTFGVTGANLSQALNYRRNSKTAIAMRKMALENGGILLVEPRT